MREQLKHRPKRREAGTAAGLDSLHFDLLFNSAVCISRRHRYVYVKVPKAGTTTMSIALHRLELDGLGRRINVNPHPNLTESPFIKPFQLPLEELSEVLAGQDFFRFTLVRDPCARLLSAYLDKIAGTGKLKLPIAKELGIAPDATISFEQFVGFVCERSPNGMNRHWRPQVLMTYHHLIPYTLVIRIEELGERLPLLVERLGPIFAASFEDRSPHRTGASDKLARYYTPDLVRRVSEKFADDFTAFGYDPETTLRALRGR